MEEDLSAIKAWTKLCFDRTLICFSITPTPKNPPCVHTSHKTMFPLLSRPRHSGNCAEPADPQPGGWRGSNDSPNSSIPLEPRALLGIPHIIFKQSPALRSQRSVPLYLYSEGLANPSQCCLKSFYCCFSRERFLC